MKRISTLAAACITVAFAAGCSSTSQSTAVKEAPKAETAPGEKYTRVTPTGTWISQRVKKSQTQASEQESIQAQQAMSELQRKGNKVARGPGG